MEICHVAINNIFLPPYEGGGVHELEIAKNLSSLGNSVYMFTDRREGEAKKDLIEGIAVRRLGVYALKRRFLGKSPRGSSSEDISESRLNLKRKGVKVLGIFFGLMAVPLIIRIAKKCDVIYERSSSFGAGVFVSILLRKPLVVEVVDEQRIGFLLRFADGVVTHADCLIPRGFDRDRVLVMENAADTEKFNPKVKGDGVRRKYGVRRGPVITYVGGFHPWHGLENIVKAANLLVKEFPEVKFMMVGDGPEKERIVNMVKEIGMESNFLFPGKVSHDKIPEYLAASDILVSIYNQELYREVNLTTKLYEYMAMGKPVIVYGVKEGELKHNVNGLLLKKWDCIESDLSGYCKKLLKNKRKGLEIGRKARLTVSKFSWRSRAESINKMFTEIMR